MDDPPNILLSASEVIARYGWARHAVTSTSRIARSSPRL